MNATCSSCGESKPHNNENFVPSSVCRNGVSRVCRTCRAAYHRAWKSRNRERLIKRRRRLYATNEKVVEARQLRKRWAEDPVWQRAKVMREGMRTRSKEKDLPFDRAELTRKFIADWLRQRPSCECCGKDFDLGRKEDGTKNDASPTVDRIVPSRGYVIGNVALLCWRCNNLKRDAKAEELEAIASWMRGNEVGKFAAPRPVNAAEGV